MVVDPPEGTIPAQTPAAQARLGAGPAAARGAAPFGEGGRADSYTDRSFYDRCITRGLPGSMMPAIYGNAYDITQAPGLVAIRYEMIHETRIIPLDNSPRTGLRAHMGDARGRWEGNTLVVETTNFDPRTTYRNASAKLTLVERFKPRGAGQDGMVGDRQRPGHLGAAVDVRDGPDQRSRAGACSSTRATRATTPCATSSAPRVPRRRARRK